MGASPPSPFFFLGYSNDKKQSKLVTKKLRYIQLILVSPIDLIDD